MRKLCGVVGVAVALSWSVAATAVELPSVFDHHMVIQRDAKVPVWGWAPSESKVTVEFGGQTRSAVADANGKWKVVLDPMKASTSPQVMSVAQSDTPAGAPARGPLSLKFSDVLIGDNWICSGQSNMEFALSRTTNASDVIAEIGKYPNIRFFRPTDHVLGDQPKDNCPGNWKAVNAETANTVTAVGYLFGRRLNQELGVPIGLIMATWGGNRIEPFTNFAGFHMVPELASYCKSLDRFDPSTEVGKQTQLEYIQKMADWIAPAKAAAEAGKPVPPLPTMPARDNLCRIYNGMIAPFVPFAVKGATWYQGEANGNEGIAYFHKMKALIGGWRKDFGQDLAFYWVQLPAYQDANPDPKGGDGWAMIREAQLKSLEIPNTGMAVTIDLADAGDPGNIHPKNKQDVGWRLAQWALVQTYGRKDLVPSGPLFKKATIEGSKIRVTFDYTGSGLMAGKKEGIAPVAEVAKLSGFAVAGADQKWYWADAVIDGKTVVVSCKDVPKPVAVRYAFSGNPETANLYNKEGIPASPFRSDDW